MPLLEVLSSALDAGGAAGVVDGVDDVLDAVRAREAGKINGVGAGVIGYGEGSPMVRPLPPLSEEIATLLSGERMLCPV